MQPSVGVLGVTVGEWPVIVGVDLDSCLDANGLAAEWAEEVIGRFGSYSEISPYQTGAKIFALVAGADLPFISAMIGGGLAPISPLAFRNCARSSLSG